jgi:alkyl hydroperoxide reductase subunit AhpC
MFLYLVIQQVKASRFCVWSSSDLKHCRHRACTVSLQAQRLPFPLLTDQSEFLRKSFGIKGDLLGLLPGRQTYVIDKSGKVVLSFNDQVSSSALLSIFYNTANVHVTTTPKVACNQLLTALNI